MLPLVRDDLVGQDIDVRDATGWVQGYLFRCPIVQAVRAIEFASESEFPEHTIVFYGIIEDPMQYMLKVTDGYNFPTLGEYETYPNRWYVVSTERRGSHLWGIVQPITSSSDWQWYVNWNLSCASANLHIGSGTAPGPFWETVKKELGFGQEFEQKMIWWMPEQLQWPFKPSE